MKKILNWSKFNEAVIVNTNLSSDEDLNQIAKLLKTAKIPYTWSAEKGNLILYDQRDADAAKKIVNEYEPEEVLAENWKTIIPMLSLAASMSFNNVSAKNIENIEPKAKIELSNSAKEISKDKISIKNAEDVVRDYAKKATKLKNNNNFVAYGFGKSSNIQLAVEIALMDAKVKISKDSKCDILKNIKEQHTIVEENGKYLVFVLMEVSKKDVSNSK